MNKKELEVLVRRHQVEIYRYIRYLGADAAEAEDIAQETFIAAYRSNTFPDDENARREAGWLRGTARNLLYQMFKQNTRNREVIEKIGLQQKEQVWVNEFLRGDDGSEYVEALHQCVNNLPPKQTNALEMKYRRRMSRLDMATALLISTDGVKSLLRRIRASLKTCIQARLNLSEEGL